MSKHSIGRDSIEKALTQQIASEFEPYFNDRITPTVQPAIEFRGIGDIRITTQSDGFGSKAINRLVINATMPDTMYDPSHNLNFLIDPLHEEDEGNKPVALRDFTDSEFRKKIYTRNTNFVENILHKLAERANLTPEMDERLIRKETPSRGHYLLEEKGIEDRVNHSLTLSRHLLFHPSDMLRLFAASKTMLSEPQIPAPSAGK